MRGILYRMLATIPLVLISLLAAVPTAKSTAVPAAVSTAVSATAPADDEMAWIMSHATTLPATAPAATAPAGPPASSPFVDKPLPGSRPGTITLSDGRTITGRIRTTLEKPIRVFDLKTEQFRDIPWSLIRSMEAHILWERDEKEWHFKDSGSDIKEYTGKTYPAHEIIYTVTLLNGQQVSGSVTAPLHAQSTEGEESFALHKRDKGAVGQTLKDLVYVKKVEMGGE